MKTYYSQNEIENAKKKPKVIHFTGELFNRPWFLNCSHPMKQIYLDYLAKSPWKTMNLFTNKSQRIVGFRIGSIIIVHFIFMN